ncbi:hypothetical protein TD95_001375 [Thielaviopsis punctulata]|uniref:Ribosomal RNA-processing protein 1 n=1 Tax=Thielaviopsis punctulata TaxID=72032 RepID=A0A0F4Z8H2_9PEZI|nr:hypothetical protein TD95_001375 [Thielaviopsis punctulata]
MAEASNLPFIRNLASNEKKIRTKAIDQLTAFLSTRRAPSSTLSDTDALKLWKGLFYAVWMCDRPIPQQNLCAELGLLIDALDASAVQPWLAAFWAVLSQNWNTEIDVLRMEKFMLLVRRVVAGSFRRLRADAFAQHALDAVLGTLRAWPFDPSGDLDRVPVGLRMHVVDLWVDELEREGYFAAAVQTTDKKGKKKIKAKSEELREAETAVVEEVQEMVLALTKKFPSKPLRERAAESLEDPRLSGETGDAEETKNDDNGSWDGFEE